MSLKLRYRKLSKLVKLSSNVIREFGFRYFLNAALYEFKKNKLTVFAAEPVQVEPTYSDTAAYNTWSLEHHLTEEVELKMRGELASYSIQPKISIVLSIDDRHIQYLKKTLLSMIDQMYENFEIHLVYSKSINDQVYSVVREISDSRVIVDSKLEQTELNKISLSTSGKFLAFVNCGDLLTKDALFQVIKLLNKDSDVNIIYFDDDENIQMGKEEHFSSQTGRQIYF